MSSKLQAASLLVRMAAKLVNPALVRIKKLIYVVLSNQYTI